MNKAYIKAKTSILRTMRPIILERDNHRCIICQTEERLETAHYLGLAKYLKKRMRIDTADGSKRFRQVEPLSWGELNHRNNLAALCGRCHAIYDKRWWNVPEIKELYRRIREIREGRAFIDLPQDTIRLIMTIYSEIDSLTKSLEPESKRIGGKINSYLSRWLPPSTIEMSPYWDTYSVYQRESRITWVK